MTVSMPDGPDAARALLARLGAGALRLPALVSTHAKPARVYDVRRVAPHTLEVLETNERYRLCAHYLAKIENREHQAIGYVRLGVATKRRCAYAFKEIKRIDAAARALGNLHDEQTLGVQAQSDIAGRTLLRSPSREYLMLPLMAGDMAELRHARGRGRTTAMLQGLRAVLVDLQRCHDRGVAHRDIKPANILHRGTPQSVRLCDFGLAQSVHAQSHGTGTPDHMAPEQHWARIGKTSGHAPVPADVWGTGAAFLDIWVGNPFRCADKAQRTRMHLAYVRWYPRTASMWRWRFGGVDTMPFAWAFGRLPKAVRPLMLRLLHPEASRRITVREALLEVETLLEQFGDRTHAAKHYQQAAQRMCKRWDIASMMATSAPT